MMFFRAGLGGAVVFGMVVAAAGSDLAEESAAVLRREFVFDKASFPQCHASTIAETRDGQLVIAWFGGTREKHEDVCIWVSSQLAGKWSLPVEVANGIQTPESRFPCWNPVLFQSQRGPLQLFFKVGPSPQTWWGEVLISHDNGRSWIDRKKLSGGNIGPVKNKPIELLDGTILSGSSTEHRGWRVHFERSNDGGKTWQPTVAINDGQKIGAIQPSILQHTDGSLQALGRSRQKKIWESWSLDGGRTWSEIKLTSLPNPNSGTDAITLKDGRHLLVYNHTTSGRSPLNVAISEDGKQWAPSLDLEVDPGEYSYPAVIQTSEGLVHVTYTWRRQKIRHVVIDPMKL